jgi:ACR3 family arsenite efflux pump ArsB
MERGLMMLLHSCIIGLILYILMVFVFKQNEMVAENRSILITAVILIYMILFGHGIPDKLNKNL